MSPLKSSLIVALVSVAATAGGLYYLQQQRGREAASLRRQNNAMRVQLNQRWQSRKPDAAPDATVAGQAATPRANPLPAPGRGPVDNYRNEGQASPRAALQTLAWACDRGDAETVGRMIYFDESARRKLEVYLAAVLKDNSTQWKSVDDLAASMLTYHGMSRPFPNADILEVAVIETVSEDRAMLRLRGTARDRTQFQRTAEGWKYVVTEALVDAYIAQTGSR